MNGAEKIHPVTIFKHFDEVDGLTTKMVYSIIQDTDGFMWFATDAGIFRYDGKTFRHFTVDDGLTDNEILQLYQDRRGRIWFLTLNGYPSYWFKGKIHNGGNTPFLKNAFLGNSLATAYEDRSGKLWLVGLKSGLVVIDDTLTKKFLLPPEIRMWGSSFVYEDEDAKIWYFYRNTMINILGIDSLHFTEELFKVSQSAKGGQAYACLSDGLYKIEDKKFEKKINASDIPPVDKIINMIVRNDSIWLCTSDTGCYLYIKNKFVRRYLENYSVSSALEDREGNIWFSSLNEGVYLLPRNNGLVSNYDKSSGLSSEKMTSISKGNNNTIWIGYNNGIVDKISENEKQIFNLKTKNEPDFFRVTSLLFDNDTLWCGTDLACYFITNNIITRVGCWKDPYNRYAIKQIIRGNDGAKYACFSFNYIKIENHQNKLYARMLLDSIVRNFSALSLEDHKFLISSNYGLMEYSPGKYFRSFTQDTTLLYLRMIDMKTDIDGLLLLSTNHKGLIVLNGNKIVQHITSNEGLANNNCGKMYLDSNQLFISSENGVSILNKEKGKWKVARILTKQNGLMSNNANDITTDKDKIYIATDKGLSIIDRRSFSSKVYYTHVKITEIISDVSQEVNEDKYSFKSDVSRLLIRFSYPVYNPMNQTLLSYRFKDNSSESVEWNTTTNNEVEFSSITPGNYIFEIKPIGADNEAAVTTLQINIIPKWYQTTTAKFLGLITASVLFLFVARRRVKVQYEKRLYELRQTGMIEMERNRIASDMHDDIGADLTQITIWLNILKQKEFAGNNIIQKVSSLSRGVLKKMDEIIWALNYVHNSSDDLFSYLHSFASESLESSDIKLDFKVHENFPKINLSAFQRRNVFLVIKELLHNTIKHSEAKNVRINISKETKGIMIEYTDDGRGFLLTEKTGGLGLITMSRRMSEINSSISVQSAPEKGIHCFLNIEIKN